LINIKNIVNETYSFYKNKALNENFSLNDWYIMIGTFINDDDINDDNSIAIASYCAYQSLVDERIIDKCIML